MLNTACCCAPLGRGWIERRRAASRVAERLKFSDLLVALRAALDLKMLGERTITVDCDVIQADGGPEQRRFRGCVAVVDALNDLQRAGELDADPLKHLISAVSVGVWNGLPIADLDYAEDSTADSDMNVVMTEQGGLIEVQGTAEGATFSQEELTDLLALATSAGEAITSAQRAALSAG